MIRSGSSWPLSQPLDQVFLTGPTAVFYGGIALEGLFYSLPYYKRASTPLKGWVTAFEVLQRNRGSRFLPRNAQGVNTFTAERCRQARNPFVQVFHTHATFPPSHKTSVFVSWAHDKPEINELSSCGPTGANGTNPERNGVVEMLFYQTRDGRPWIFLQ